MSTGAVTCPQTIAAENHKVITGQYWKDPVYRALVETFLRENKECEYCGGKAALVYHDNATSYHSKEEYYNPANFTPCCLSCHHQYRNGRAICPVCHKHYMKRDAEQCRWCRGMPYAGRKTTRRKPITHACGHRVGQQRCQRDGKFYVCGHSSKHATCCTHFTKRAPVKKP